MEYEYRNTTFLAFHYYIYNVNWLIFILNITEKCANNYLNECIGRIEQRCIVYVRSILLKQKIKKELSSNETNKLYNVYFAYKKSYEGTASNTSEGQKFMERMAYCILNSARAIQTGLVEL